MRSLLAEAEAFGHATRTLHRAAAPKEHRFFNYSRLPIPVPLLGGVRGGFLLPTPYSPSPDLKLLLES
ncbi:MULTISPECIES: hypothetical protein [unclassified Moorena]|uniref:hypothetical protein n=1 Tax=unclassified Moorena TaxID=2683338 RepID=UPI0013B9022A|nr:MULTISPECIES: hypothetical protein [unclassified Moorena]NEP33146.1 hypothetical protein [Moorena sp. SIO3B2]NEQ16887.1 hypothetical protein [Moorena sp. SIO3E2]NER89762.1 hypothetical protein [Moorena sp. SIO3A2]